MPNGHFLVKFWKCQKAVSILPHVVKHYWNYFAFNQSYLAKGKIAPVVLLPHEAKKTRFYLGGAGLDRTGDFQKFCRSGLDRIRFHRIRTGLGVKNFTVRSSLQSTTTASHQSTVRLCWVAQYSMVSDYICKLWSCRG